MIDITVNTIISLTLRIILSFLLIPRLGVVGAALVLTGTALVLNIIGLLEVFFLLRLLPYNRDFIKPVLAGLITIVVTYFAVLWINIPSVLISTTIGILCLSGTYVVSILSMGLSREDQLERPVRVVH